MIWNLDDIRNLKSDISIYISWTKQRHKRRNLHGFFVDFHKAFDIVPREQLLQRFSVLKIPYMNKCLDQLGVWRKLSKVITTTIGEARIPTLPALFKLYINEVTDYIIHRDGEGINILNTSVQILLYADDIFFITESQ